MKTNQILLSVLLCCATLKIQAQNKDKETVKAEYGQINIANERSVGHSLHPDAQKL